MSLIIWVRQAGWTCALVAIALAAPACDRSAPPPAPSTPAASPPEQPTPPAPAAAKLSHEHAEIVSRADAAFDFAAYLKPRDELTETPTGKLAPLMTIRVTKDKEKAPPGRLPWPAHAPDDEEAAPTLYFVTDQDKFGNEAAARTSFIWFNRDDAGKSGADSSAGAPPYTAVSFTVDRRGTTIIARVIQSGSTVDRYFVSELLEAAARKEHGPPLAGRRFSIERASSPVDAKPSGSKPHDFLVPKLMFSAPEPAGPWVYIDGQDGFVTTVHCRCSASQIKVFTDKVEFDIKPVSDIPASTKVPDLSAQSSVALRLPTTVP